MKAAHILPMITGSPLSRTTWLWFGRFPLGSRRLGEDLALVDLVERLAQLDAGSGAEHAAAHFLQKRELLRTGIERNEVNLYGALALPEDIPRHFVGPSPARVLAVGDHEQVLAEDAGAIQVGPRRPQRLADGRAAARPRHLTQRGAHGGAIVRLNRHQRAHVARETVDADFD